MNNVVYSFIRLFPAIKRIYYLYWNRLLFKLLGINYGNNLRVYNKIYLLGKGSITIGKDFSFTSGDSINPLCRNIRGAMYTTTTEAQIVIGDRVGISSACLWAKEKITIGNDVKIGGDCLIMDNDAHPIDFNYRRDSFVQSVGRDDYYSKIGSSPIEIGDDVWIGARCQILKGVHIGKRSIIAAGSIVTKDIPSDVVAGGIPCRIIRPI